MPITEKIHECECEDCQEEKEHPNRALHQQINVLVSRLDEQQLEMVCGFGVQSDRARRRCFVMVKITGMDEKTIRRGRREMEAGLVNRPATRVRLPGGGRPSTEKN